MDLIPNWVERNGIRYEHRKISETLSLFQLSYHRRRTWLSLCETEDRMWAAALTRLAGYPVESLNTHTLFTDQPPHTQRWMGCSYQE